MWRNLLVDVTACPIIRPHDHQKLKQLPHTSTHGFCACSHYPGSVHDLTIYHTGGLPWEITYEEEVLGDKGYIGGYKVVAPFRGQLSEEQRLFNLADSRRRILIERAFGRLKEFQSVHRTWRHDKEKHKQVFAVCVFLTNLKIKERPFTATLINPLMIVISIFCCSKRYLSRNLTGIVEQGIILQDDEQSGNFEI